MTSARLYHSVLGLSWIAIALPLAWAGLDYYLTPLADRPFAPGHDLFRPTGYVGNRLGIAGTGMIAFGVAMYVTRKRMRRLAGLGPLRHWLSFHIWLCTLGPFLILLHTSMKVGGIVSIAFWSMVIVVSSGLVGRYVYAYLPKTVRGNVRTMREVEAETDEAWAALQTSAPPAALALYREHVHAETPRSLLGALPAALRLDLAGRRAERALVAEMPEPAEAVRLGELARRHRRLALSRTLLDPFARLFRYWHAIHLPLAIIMGLIVLLHVGIAFAFGYAWTPAP